MIKHMTEDVEANIISCMYGNPELFFEYSELNASDFQNGVWQLFFAIGQKMVAKGMKKLGNMDVDVFVKNNTSEKVQVRYDKYGGYINIENVEGIANEENLPVYIDTLKKWSAFNKLKVMFDKDMADTDKISHLSLNQLYYTYTARINDLFVNIEDDVSTTLVADGLDEMFEEANRGQAKGLPINSPILCDTINGINMGAITLVAGQSGSGKSTWLIQQVGVSVFEHEESAVFFLNEQSSKKFKQELLTYIINHIVIDNPAHSFNKKRWRDGGFSQQEWEWIRAAKDILTEKTRNNKIVIVEFKKYKHQTILRSIKKYAAMGVKVFAIDTFKLPSDANPNNPFWLELQQNMVDLDDLVKESNLNVALICTLQLGKGAILNRYLSPNDLGMSKNVIDVASVCLLIRKMYPDEYLNEKNELRVYKPIGGSSKEDVILNSGKRHSIIFIPKNRFGVADEFQVVALHEFGTFTYNEMGITHVPINT